MNDVNTVRRVLALLDEWGVQCWLFGGWAEELRGLRTPGPHTDIDLLYPADGFAAVKAFLASGQVEEIAAKRLFHKRAFLFDGVMTELFLVHRDQSGLHTMFWGSVRHDWPDNTLDSPASFEWPVASPAALTGYRQNYRRLAVGREPYLARGAEAPP